MVPVNSPRARLAMDTGLCESGVLMRILFAIPHYFGQIAAGNYGSERSQPYERARVIRQCLASLRQTFSETQALVDGRQSHFRPANPRFSADVRIAVCTTGNAHLASELQGIGFDHVHTDTEPRHLGFE